MTDRRGFLRRLGAAALAPSVAHRLLAEDEHASVDDGARIRRIGLQLYTVRDLMKRNVESTLARVASIGYEEVEFAGYFGRTPRQIREALDHAGLRSPSVHVGLEEVRGRWRETLDAAHVIGHRYVVVASVDAKERRTLDDWRRVAETFDAAADEAHRAGIGFAYHNHDFEFEPIESRIPLDVLLEHSNRELVKIEMDLYWITKGGQDPLAYFARWPGRFPMVHVKDSAGAPAHAQRDVGKGTIDFRRIFAKSGEAGIEHYFVERDEPPNPLASIRASYRYLHALTF
ncbi:MAG: sugar phosphate isomerase/epimerase [Gemmatimonadota bacterium]|nr:sugar phosphate isomerase/epimerase [Gemmatimonadota bacterium]